MSDRRAFLTIGTYPVTKAFDAAKALAKRPPKTPTARDIYVAFPNADYQIEVYDPTPGTARKLVKSEQVVAVG